MRRSGRPGRAHAADDAGHASVAVRRNRRARDRQSERPGAGSGADRARLELLLPAGLQLDAGADRRQVPRDQGAAEAARLDVRARKGYWALHGRRKSSAPTRRRSQRRRSRSAGARLDLRRAVQAAGRADWLGTARGEKGKTRVTFVWEPLPPTPGQRGAISRSRRVSLLAAVPRAIRSSAARVPERAAAAAHRRVRPRRRVGRQGGATQLRRLAGRTGAAPLGRRQGGRSIDSTARSEIDGPGLHPGAVSFSTPRVYRVRTVPRAPGDRGRRRRRADGRREFWRTERLLIRFDVYGGQDAAPTAVLLNRSGQKMADLPVQRQRPQAEIDLGLSAIAAGEYLIEINAKTDRHARSSSPSGSVD